MNERARHPHNRLTDRSIRSAAADDRTRRIADGGGLYLLVAPSGSKSWLLRTVVGGKRRDLGLGSVRLVSLAEAREAARRLRRLARGGGNPVEERDKQNRRVPTFEAAACDVHRSLSSGFKNLKHRSQWLSSLRVVFEQIGSKQVDEVSKSDLLAVMHPHWLERPETARRVLQRIRVVLEWSKAKGYCSGDNAVDGLTKLLPRQRASQRHHAALPYADINIFMASLRSGDADETVKMALEFTVLCAARTGEVINATWSEIDLKTRTWTVPADRMKGGREHRVPLSDRCVKILERAQALSDGDGFVFPGRAANKPLSNMAFLMALRRLGYGHVTTHGFRSSFRDWSEERTSTPRAVSEAALAHALKDKVEAAYRRTDLYDKRRELMQLWAKFVEEPAKRPAGVSHE